MSHSVNDSANWVEYGDGAKPGWDGDGMRSCRYEVDTFSSSAESPVGYYACAYAEDGSVGAEIGAEY